MKFKITLKIDRKYGDLLPFNYQYEQSAVIYRILTQADTQYSSWLHKNGYLLHERKRFKLFCYSPFIFEKVRPLPEAGCLKIIDERAVWYISFIPEKVLLSSFKVYLPIKAFQLAIRSIKLLLMLLE